MSSNRNYGTRSFPEKRQDRWLRHSTRIRSSEFVPRTVSNVQNFDHLPSLDDAVYYTVDMRVAAIQEVPESLFLGRNRTPVWELFQSEDLTLQTLVPFPRGFGRCSVDFPIEMFKVALRAQRDINEVCHAGIQTG